MNLRAAELFARPLPYKLVWALADGRLASAASYHRSTADRLFEELEEIGQLPVMWLGGLVVAGDEDEALRQGGVL